MKTCLTIILSLLFSPVSWSQTDLWQSAEFFKGSLVGDLPYAGILERENDIHVFNGWNYTRWEHYGRQLASVRTAGYVWSNAFFAADNEDFFVYAHVNNSSVDKNIFINSLLPDGQLALEEFELEDSYSSTSERGPTGLKLAQDHYLIIGQSKMYELRFENAQEVEIVWSRDHNFGLISEAVLLEEHIVLASHSGRAFFINFDGSLFIERDLGFPLNAVEETSTGLIFAGEDNTLIKTNKVGFIEWEKTYTFSSINDISIGSADEIIVTGKSVLTNSFVIKYDEQGNELWKLPLPDREGIAVRQSYYQDQIVLVSRNGDFRRVEMLSADGQQGTTLISEIQNYSLDVGNINTQMEATGWLFFDGLDGLYEYPKGEDTQTILFGQLWLAAKDEEGLLYASEPEYISGPKSFVDENYESIFPKRVWSMSQIEIDKFRTDLADGKKDIPWSADYMYWPAKGNTIRMTDGTWQLLTEDLAPFVDVNEDGLYQPLAGDYPKIKGEQMLWCILNDQPNLSISNTVGVDISLSFFAYSCQENELMSNTTFLDIDITNRSGRNYPEFKFGLAVNPEIGCSRDDYIGSIPEYNSVFAYNQNLIDGGAILSCPSNSILFEEEIPLQSVTLLNQPMTSAIYYDQWFDFPISSFTHPPGSEMAFYNFLSGRWRNGIALTYGGTGVNQNSQDTTLFVYDGDPSIAEEWSQCTAIPDLGDRDQSLIPATGFVNIKDNDKVNIQIALITHENIPLPCPALSGVKSTLSQMQDFHDAGWLAISTNFFPDTIYTDELTYTLDPGLSMDQYNWSTGATSPMLTVTESGTYGVELTLGDLCPIRDEVFVKFNRDEILVSETLIIYPNPSLGNITIQNGKWEPGEERYVRIYSIIGQLIDELRLTVSEDKKLELSVLNLAHGVYVLSLFTLDGERELSGKIVLGD